MVLNAEFVVQSTTTVFWLFFWTLDLYLWLPYQALQLLQRRLSQQAVHRKRPKKTVVIVGASFSGLSALRYLQNKALFHVILIDQRDYFEYTPGVLKLLCDSSYFSKLGHQIPTRSGYEFIQGTVSKIWNSHVTFHRAKKDTNAAQSSPFSNSTETTIKFDFLVLATGSTYKYPISASSSETTLASRARGWKASARRVQEARSILVLGGGAVGTELAAELACHYRKQQKQITLVDASPKLVPLFPAAASQHAEEWLKRNHVTLRLGQTLRKWDDKSCTMMDGTVLHADMVFVCFGDKPNSAPMVDGGTAAIVQNSKKSHSNSLVAAHKHHHQGGAVQLDPRQCVRVDEFLRVQGRTNIFACGDVAAPPLEGMKQAYHAEVMGHVAAENIERLVHGQRFVRYPEGVSGTSFMPFVFVLSLGRWDGVLGFNDLCIPGPLAAIVKWVLEWTKIRQMLNRPVGILIWLFGDTVTLLLSKTILRPRAKRS